MPNDSVMTAYRADTLSIADLRNLLMLHFVQGNLIFTDGSTSPGYYKTTRIDESSTEFSVVFSSIYINPGIDIITIPDRAGNAFLNVEEAETTNLMTGRNLGEGTEVFPVVIINSVIHQTDRVLDIEQLDSK